MINPKKYALKKKASPPSLAISSHLRKIARENQQLQELLLEVTDKQHQEMSRAIQLKAKNTELEKLLHDAKLQEIMRIKMQSVRKSHQSYADKLQELLEENNYLNKELVLARKKRLEASKQAEKLAEANYCLQNIYGEVYEQIQRLKARNDNNERCLSAKMKNRYAKGL